MTAACSTNPDRDTSRADAAEATSECQPALDQAFGAWADSGFSGSVAISTGGEPDCLAGYGTADQGDDTPNTADTVFSIGSVTKAFTAAAVLDLVDQGELSLDDRAGDIVPGLDGPAAEATVQQLLLHTSGLTGAHGQDHVALDRDAAIAAIGGLEQAFEPGAKFLYSNAGYTLLALIVEEVSDTSFREHVVSRVLTMPDGDVVGGFWDGEPAAPGRRAVGYLEEGTVGESGDFTGPHWALEGNGGLAMTMRDLALWAQALFAGQLLSADATEAVRTLAFDQGDGTAEIPGWVAFDAAIYGEPVFTSAGGGGSVGHDVVVAVLPDSERVVAIASNTSVVTAEDLLAAVGPALLAGEPLPLPETQGGSVDPDAVAAIAGTYQLDSGGSFAVAAEDDRLGIAATGTDAVAVLFPLPDAFTTDDVAAHEQAVRSLLDGATQEGRDERASLESDLGPIDDVALAGTIVHDGELRTYVTVTSGQETLALWYALDEEGGISAAVADTEPPTLLLVPSDGGGYRPDDPSGASPDLAVSFDDGGMTVVGPAGTHTARPAP